LRDRPHKYSSVPTDNHHGEPKLSSCEQGAPRLVECPTRASVSGPFSVSSFRGIIPLVGRLPDHEPLAVTMAPLIALARSCCCVSVYPTAESCEIARRVCQSQAVRPVLQRSLPEDALLATYRGGKYPESWDGSGDCSAAGPGRRGSAADSDCCRVFIGSIRNCCCVRRGSNCTALPTADSSGTITDSPSRRVR